MSSEITSSNYDDACVFKAQEMLSVLFGVSVKDSYRNYPTVTDLKTIQWTVDDSPPERSVIHPLCYEACFWVVRSGIVALTYRKHMAAARVQTFWRDIALFRRKTRRAVCEELNSFHYHFPTNCIELLARGGMCYQMAQTSFLSVRDRCASP